MKKYTLYSLMLLTLLFLSACSNSAQPKEENDVQSIKDVTVKIHTGDRDRKAKLLEKQKRGKARMKRFGKVDIPSEAFTVMLKRD